MFWKTYYKVIKKRRFLNFQKMLIELKKIESSSVLKCCSVVFFMLGLVIGIVSFVYALFTQNLTTGGILVGFLAIILYAVIFSIITSIVVVLISLFYNIVLSKLGGIKVVIESE
ncbi:hypothetical protein KAU39_00140 [bacterium]|nr:hypothetical protein [bacterium]